MLYNKLSKHLNISEYVNTLMKTVINLAEVSHMNSGGYTLTTLQPTRNTFNGHCSTKLAESLQSLTA
jgi:hypothetical protein